MAGNGWGPPLVDFSQVANLGQTFQRGYDDAQKRTREREQRDALNLLGNSLTGDNPDYVGSAQRAFRAGDANTGLTLLKLGEAAKERQGERDILKSWSGVPGASGQSPAAAAAPSGDGGTGPQASLIQNESGGRWNAQNNAMGAGGQRGHFGRVQFGQARLQEAAAAGAIPQGITPQQFMQSPEIQQSAERWHFGDIDNFIKQRGYDRAVGQMAIGGVPVTVEGMRAVAHLGGKEGLAKFIETQGRYNPADENGTRLSDYFARHGGGGQPTQVAAPISPVQRQPLGAPGVQVAENEADVRRIEAQMPGYGGGQPQQGAPVQTAQADMPAPSAQQAQFATPGTPVGQSQGIMSDEKVQLWSQRLAGAPTDRLRNIAQAQLNLAVEDAKRRNSANEPTGDIKEYNFYRQQSLAAGKQPDDFTTWARGNKAAGATSITNDMRGENAEAKGIGEAAAKRAGETMAAATNGTKQLQRIGQLDALMKNVETGRLEPGRMSMAALGKSLGVNEDFLRGMGLDPAKVGDAQALNAIAGRMVVDMIGAGGFPANNFSDADRAFITGTVPSLANDPRGNRIIMEAAKRTAQIDIEKARSWRDFKKSNPKVSFDDFETAWNEKLATEDRFGDLAKAAEAITGAPAGNAGQQGGGWSDLGGGVRIRERR
jgi:hypothetical protein